VDPVTWLLGLGSLFVFGVIVWLRADKLTPPSDADSHDEHGDGHGHH